ncbi:hypothetical protein [Ramlibacter tataouinensis]|uniref:Uncharacterized protein n=1 Tax=Ramlibacter tataouinensis (strain ATCC BAA-407 / DSM 14655 / LMG 21543 / TTB310) TaxID=365046 RepID=F5XYQ0_RAMTT|nr:hypothetical protein [Ramlibacter tataouinensis]AEG94417.1 Hypothetical protein Rta_33050 [Ramlibacter tataouinensis TTB310]
MAPRHCMAAEVPCGSTALPSASAPAGLLRVSTRLAQGPAPSQRAVAALQWEVLRSHPQDLLRVTYRLQEMEGELAALRKLAARQREAMTSLQRQVGEAATGSAGFGLLAWVALVLALALAGGWASFFLQPPRAAARRLPSAVDVDLSRLAKVLREHAHA